MLNAGLLVTPHNRYRRFLLSELTYRQWSMGIQESSIGLDWIDWTGMKSSPNSARLKKTGVRESRTPENISKSLRFKGFRIPSERISVLTTDGAETERFASFGLQFREPKYRTEPGSEHG